MKVNVDRTELKRLLFKFGLSLLITILLGLVLSGTAYAASVTVDLDAGTSTGGNGILDLIMLFALLALMPSIVIMMTSFTRIVIVLSLLRTALGTQQSPPNQVLISIALILTLFIMAPVVRQINAEAYMPYQAGTITQTEAVSRAVVPMKEFMLRQTQVKELNLFLGLAGQTQIQVDEENPQEQLTSLGLEVIVPAFITSELKKAFTIGFYLFIPFLIIDMVVSSTLMSMGMVMLPPSMISMPFKLLLFVLVDGWNLLFNSLVQGFY